MAKQANRMMIGGFVVLAVLIMAASLVVFGSGKFFQKTMQFVLFFDGSIKGLSVGAPVLFKGVQIGSVTSITMQIDLAKMQAQIPVLIELEPDRWKVVGGERGTRKNLEKLIEKGLRAQLGMQSFITGQLMIELDFYPGSPLVLKNIDKQYVEIPTIPSTTEKLADALSKLDLAALEKHLETALDGFAKLANDPNLTASIRGLKETLQEARNTLQDARKFVTRVDSQVNPLSKNLNKTLTDFGKLAVKVDDQVGGVATGFDKTMSAARGVLSQDSPLMVELENALKEIAAMSRSMRQLTNYLDQHPEALIRGKGNPGGK